MNRRRYLALLSASVPLGIGGCAEREYGYGDPKHEVRIRPRERIPTDGGWKTNVALRPIFGRIRQFEDLTLLAFDRDGDSLASVEVGALPQYEGQKEERLTVETDEFPAILTATAEVSPCDGALIDIVYWVGPEEYRPSSENYDGFLWNKTNRQCDEPIPPPRVLEDVGYDEE